MVKPVDLFRFPGFAHFIVVVAVTIVEIVGLVLWLNLRTMGALVLSVALLFVALLIEHVVSQVDHAEELVSGREFLEIVAFSIIEVAVWVVWLLLIPVNGILAFLFFLAALFVEHQITDNVKKGLGFLHFSRPRTLVFLGLVIFTISEVVGAALWVSTTQLIALAAGSLIEHYIARNVGQITEQVPIVS